MRSSGEERSLLMKSCSKREYSSAQSPENTVSLTPGQVIGNIDDPPILVGHHAIVKHGKPERSWHDGGLDAVMSPSPYLKARTYNVSNRHVLRMHRTLF